MVWFPKSFQDQYSELSSAKFGDTLAGELDGMQFEIEQAELSDPVRQLRKLLPFQVPDFAEQYSSEAPRPLVDVGGSAGQALPDAGMVDLSEPTAGPQFNSPLLSAGSDYFPAEEPSFTGGASVGGSFAPGAGSKSGVVAHADLISRASGRYGVPSDVIAGIMDIESGGAADAESGVGAKGLMQVMPFHFQPDEDPFDPETNVMKGASILADNYRRYGDWNKAAAAYFGAIDRDGNITEASDGNTTGGGYVGLFNEARGRYGSLPSAPEDSLWAPARGDSQNFTPDQFSLGLDPATAYAICGPVAAMAFARANGRFPTIEEAQAIAAKVGGWTEEKGMGGPDGMVSTIEAMGMAAHKEQGWNGEKVRRDVLSGNPVIVDTPGHYYVVEGYDPSTGKYKLGNSQGIGEWATEEQILNSKWGAPRSTIYADNPASSGLSYANKFSDTAPDPTEDPAAYGERLSSFLSTGGSQRQALLGGFNFGQEPPKQAAPEESSQAIGNMWDLLQQAGSQLVAKVGEGLNAALGPDSPIGERVFKRAVTEGGLNPGDVLGDVPDNLGFEAAKGLYEAGGPEYTAAARATGTNPGRLFGVSEAEAAKENPEANPAAYDIGGRGIQAAVGGLTGMMVTQAQRLEEAAKALGRGAPEAEAMFQQAQALRAGAFVVDQGSVVDNLMPNPARAGEVLGRRASGEPIYSMAGAAVDAPARTEAKTVTAFHLSPHENLDTLDPSYQGTGQAGAELKRREAFPDRWADYTNWYEASPKARVETHRFGGLPMYSSQFQVTNEPGGLIDVDQIGGRSYRQLKDEGYLGVYFPEDGQVHTLQSVKPEYLGRSQAGGPSAPGDYFFENRSARGLPVVKDLKVPDLERFTTAARDYRWNEEEKAFEAGGTFIPGEGWRSIGDDESLVVSGVVPGRELVTNPDLPAYKQPNLAEEIRRFAQENWRELAKPGRGLGLWSTKTEDGLTTDFLDVVDRLPRDQSDRAIQLGAQRGQYANWNNGPGGGLMRTGLEWEESQEIKRLLGEGVSGHDALRRVLGPERAAQFTSMRGGSTALADDAEPIRDEDLVVHGPAGRQVAPEEDPYISGANLDGNRVNRVGESGFPEGSRRWPNTGNVAYRGLAERVAQAGPDEDVRLDGLLPEQFENAPTLNELRQMVRESWAMAKDWYLQYGDESSRPLLELVPNNEAAALVGATSWSAPPNRNLQSVFGVIGASRTIALREFERLRATGMDVLEAAERAAESVTAREIRMTLDDFLEMNPGAQRFMVTGGQEGTDRDRMLEVAAKIVRDGLVEAGGGGKYPVFAQNTMTGMGQMAGREVGDINTTIDRWMLRAFGHRSPISGMQSERANQAIQGILKYLADEIGADPHQVQAAVWTTIRGNERSLQEELESLPGLNEAREWAIDSARRWVEATGQTFLGQSHSAQIRHPSAFLSQESPAFNPALGKDPIGFRAGGQPIYRMAGESPDAPRNPANELINEYAQEYARESGIRPTGIVDTPYVKNPVRLQKQIADTFEELPTNLADQTPEQRAATEQAYRAMGDEVEAQYQFLTNKGVRFEPFGSEADEGTELVVDGKPVTQWGDPYQALARQNGTSPSAEMQKDVAENHHLWVYASENDHPLLTPDQNWKFRGVHDYFGHAHRGFEFGPRGEENAWIEHSKMFSDEARRALTTETRGQNSWVNYGAHLRREDGSLPKRGDPDFISPTERPFAEQKSSLLPEEFSDSREADILGYRQSGEPIYRMRGAAASPAPQPRRTPGSRDINLTDEEEVERLRLDKFPDEVQDAVKQAAQDQNWVHNQRRGVLSDEAVAQLAERMERSVTDWLGSGRAGRAYNAEETVAVRRLVTGQAVLVRELTEEINQAKAAGHQPNRLIAIRAAEAERLAGLVKVAEGARAEAGRTLRAYRQQIDLVEANPEEAVERIFKLLGGDKDEALKRIDEYDKLVTQNADPRKMAEFWAKVKNPPATFSDWVIALRYNSLLSSPRTWEINAIGNALELPWRFARDIGASTLRGRPEELGPEAVGTWIGAQQGVKNFMETLRYGITEEQLARGELPARLADRVDNPLAKGAARFLEPPSRVLAATDEFFRQTTYGLVRGREAALAASAKGLRGHDWKLEVARQLANPTEEMQKKALEAALRGTYQNDMGKRGAALANFRHKAGVVGNVLIPFLRTVYNITARGIDRSPVGIIGTLADVVQKDKYGGLGNLPRALRGDVELKEGLVPLGERLGDNIMGGLIGLWFVDQAFQGNVSGAGPEDREDRDALRRDGWAPYSIKLGDKWVSYSNWGPVSIPLSMSAAIAETHRYKKVDDDMEDMALDMFRRFGELATEQSYLQGIASVYEAFAYPERRGSKTLQDLATSFVPYGAASRTAAQIRDPLERDVQSVSDAMANLSPFHRQDLPPRLNAYGQPTPNRASGVMGAIPLRISQESQDAIDRELTRIDASVSMAPREIGGVELTREQQRSYQAMSGQNVRSALEVLVETDDYKQANDTRRKDLVTSVVTDARNRASELVIAPDDRKIKDTGLPDKYYGVTTVGEERKIDGTISSVNNYLDRLRRGEEPDEEPSDSDWEVWGTHSNVYTEEYKEEVERRNEASRDRRSAPLPFQSLR